MGDEVDDTTESETERCYRLADEFIEDMKLRGARIGPKDVVRFHLTLLLKGERIRASKESSR